MAAATDYDAPRRNQIEESEDDSLGALTARRNDARSSVIEFDETELNEALELPGADLSGLSEDTLMMRVQPKQSDEFTCTKCFLVHHRNRIARQTKAGTVCRDCA